MPVLMFHEMHEGSAVQLLQHSAGSSHVNDFKMGFALCKHTPCSMLEQFPAGGAVGESCDSGGGGGGGGGVEEEDFCPQHCL